MTTETILGVSIGTRAIGLTVLRQGAVLDWYIKSFKQGWCERKLEKIIHSVEEVIEHHNIKIIALRAPCELRSGSNLTTLLHQFEKSITSKGIVIYKYKLEELKDVCEVNL